MACTCCGEIDVAMARGRVDITEIASTLVVGKRVVWPSSVQGHHGEGWSHKDEQEARPSVEASSVLTKYDVAPPCVQARTCHSV